MNIHRPRRKPDFEDERVRAWTVGKNKKVITEKEEKEAITVKKGKFSMQLLGFKKVKTKRGRLVFAFKPKKDLIMYYIPKKNPAEEREEAWEALQKITKLIAIETGREVTLQDAHDFVDHIIKNQEKMT